MSREELKIVENTFIPLLLPESVFFQISGHYQLLISSA